MNILSGSYMFFLLLCLFKFWYTPQSVADEKTSYDLDKSVDVDYDALDEFVSCLEDIDQRIKNKQSRRYYGKVTSKIKRQLTNQQAKEFDAYKYKECLEKTKDAAIISLYCEKYMDDDDKETLAKEAKASANECVRDKNYNNGLAITFTLPQIRLEAEVEKLEVEDK